MLTSVQSNPAPRHARLFELIRQQNLMQMQAAPNQASPVPAQATQAIGRAAARTILPSLGHEEQTLLGFAPAFGR